MASSRPIDLADQIITNAKANGIVHLDTQDESYNGRIITVRDNKLINFGSCSYLGLEKDYRLIEVCIDSANRYGIQFSLSRGYLSSTLYSELESLLSKLFKAPCLVTPTTTLGHISALPSIVKENDLIILDHQVHASVQMSCKLLKADGIQIQMIRHNDLNHLEQLIQEHQKRSTGKIWYCIDGVYSMFGDLAPIDEIYRLLDRYSRFYLYADDAHGMSWCGEFGRGSVRGNREHHAKMILAVSLNKAFGCAGGLLVSPNDEILRRVRACGAGVVFSGPIQPPLLGAAIASAKIYLSGEIESMQQLLKERINFCLELLNDSGLPDVANSYSPIFYIGTSDLNAGFNLTKRLHQEGYYVNTGLFPAVPLSKTGIRFTLNNHLNYSDICGFIQALSYHYPKSLVQENVSSSIVARAFKLSGEKYDRFSNKYSFLQEPEFNITVTYNIDSIAQDWRSIKIFKGPTGYDNLKLLERGFSVQQKKDVDYEHWLFRYITLKDRNDNIILVAFVILCDIKTDMFARVELSEMAESYRLRHPQAFVSRCLMLGCPISEGMHFYLDETHPRYKVALDLFLGQLKKMQLHYHAEILSLRDLDLDSWMVDHIAEKGFLIEYLPDTHMSENMRSFGSRAYLSSLKRKYRYHITNQIFPYMNYYSIVKIENLSDTTLDIFYKMYLVVQERSMLINTFPLPKNLFSTSVNNGVLLYYSFKYRNEWVGYILLLLSEDTLYSIIIGTNSEYKDKNIYRVCLYQVNLIAKELGYDVVCHGLTTSLEK